MVRREGIGRYRARVTITYGTVVYQRGDVIDAIDDRMIRRLDALVSRRLVARIEDVAHTGGKRRPRRTTAADRTED